MSSNVCFGQRRSRTNRALAQAGGLPRTAPMFARLAILLLISGISFASASAGELIGSIVSPVADLPIRSSPPGAFFRSKGAEIEMVNPGQRFRVLDQRTVSTLAGSEDWLQVQSLANPELSGWVYVGPTGTNSPNLAGP